ncbi:hypothetical protein pCXcHC2016_14 [Xenohaliotis phage pCXc-HC2016]|nr:hypothetical protein pCXcHC2016_14 [Xenohaliotis phage pCXc-HC2016]AQW89121.1 hypothetical protein pCXcHR2015_14 [Xenohaliotis phage pCXc-HR2015]
MTSVVECPKTRTAQNEIVYTAFVELDASKNNFSTDIVSPGIALMGEQAISEISIMSSAVITGAAKIQIELHDQRLVDGNPADSKILDNIAKADIAVPTAADTKTNVDLGRHYLLNMAGVAGAVKFSGVGITGYSLALSFDAQITNTTPVLLTVLVKTLAVDQRRSDFTAATN